MERTKHKTGEKPHIQPHRLAAVLSPDFALCHRLHWARQWYSAHHPQCRPSTGCTPHNPAAISTNNSQTDTLKKKSTHFPALGKKIQTSNSTFPNYFWINIKSGKKKGGKAALKSKQNDVLLLNSSSIRGFFMLPVTASSTAPARSASLAAALVGQLII